MITTFCPSSKLWALLQVSCRDQSPPPPKKKSQSTPVLVHNVMSFLSKLQSQAISNKMFCWLSALSGICLFKPHPPRKKHSLFPFKYWSSLSKAGRAINLGASKARLVGDHWNCRGACWVSDARELSEKLAKKLPSCKCNSPTKETLDFTLISFNGDKVQPNWKKPFPATIQKADWYLKSRTYNV